MKRIVVHPPSPADAGMFDFSMGTEMTAPWLYVSARLKARGYRVETTYQTGFNLSGAERILFMNVPEELRSFKGATKVFLRRHIGPLLGRPKIPNLLRSTDFSKRVLMIWEPDVVIPENSSPELHKKFARVFTWSTRLQNLDERYHPIFWPQAFEAPPMHKPPFEERKLLVNFSGNKTSSHPLELYSARKHVIELMTERFPGDFDHYGPGWDGYPLWKGTVPSKFEVLPKYRFSLCYENMRDEGGYITEKIFDGLRGGTVPIYWGAPEIADIVDPEAFVDRRKFSSDADLIQYLKDLPRQEWERMRSAGCSYLESRSFKNFLPDRFSEIFIAGLELP